MKTAKTSLTGLLAAFVLVSARSAPAQVLIQGRLHADSHHTRDPTERIPLATIVAIGNLPGADSEPVSFRTWETRPSGWFRLSGSEGRYTLAFTNPAHFMRPRILTNQFLLNRESIDLRLRGSFDFACFHEKAWDEKPARRYWQTFFACGSSVTAVGFKLATDGVDGAGPGKQDVLVSVHRRTDGHPDEWPQVGPIATVVGVDCGGAKSYWFSAGWRSGEVPVVGSDEYAVSIRAARDGGVLQAFWRPRLGGSPGVFRAGVDRRGFEPHDIWLAVSSDGDGLLIPYQKRVHRKFHSLTSLRRKWSQTWVAQGHGLASVVLYAAVSGKQPPLSRQRARVRVRQGGPGGETVGVEKLAVGNGNYTGDASWGHLVAVFAPGEIPLQPGATYALEFESIESPHTIGGFVNIKGEVSDGRAGFNPYRKHPPDEYPYGTAYADGTEACDFDLDLQIVEYAHAVDHWERAVINRELLDNGSMERGERGRPASWQPFKSGDGTAHTWAKKDGRGRFLQIAFADATHPLDGGWVQRVSDLSPKETYRLSGRVRSTWAASVERKCEIGVDSSGQLDDPEAATIEWTVLPKRHGEFVAFRGRPVRPRKDGISVWLRARCKKEDPRFPFRADFDDFSLRRVDSGVPVPNQRQVRAGFIDGIHPEAALTWEARYKLVRERRAHTPVLVHRGASRFAPENTIEAFAQALDRGADGFELDIRRSRDGVLYVFHDDTLDRVTNRTGKVRGKSYFELLECAVGAGYRIPTLAAIFTLARDRAALLHLDVKEPRLEPEILRLIEAADLWEHIVAVNAYNAASILSHGKIMLMGYKGWFPTESKPGDDLGALQKRFLERPGQMVFTKWDPIDAVHALGREARTAQPVAPKMRADWEEKGSPALP